MNHLSDTLQIFLVDLFRKMVSVWMHRPLLPQLFQILLDLLRLVSKLVHLGAETGVELGKGHDEEADGQDRVKFEFEELFHLRLGRLVAGSGVFATTNVRH